LYKNRPESTCFFENLNAGGGLVGTRVISKFSLVVATNDWQWEPTHFTLPQDKSYEFDPGWNRMPSVINNRLNLFVSACDNLGLDSCYFITYLCYFCSSKKKKKKIYV